MIAHGLLVCLFGAAVKFPELACEALANAPANESIGEDVFFEKSVGKGHGEVRKSAFWETRG